MPDELWARVQEVAKRREITAGELVRKAVEHDIGVAEKVQAEVEAFAATATPVTQQEERWKCPVCERPFTRQIRCPCSNRMAVHA